MTVIETPAKMLRDVRSEIQRINEVFPFPPVVTEILQAVSKDDVAAAKIASIIESDTALTAKILRVANSPFYGLRRDVATITEALRILGLDEIGHLLLTCQMKSRLMSLNSGQRSQLERLWRHSVAVAAVSRMMSVRFRIPTEGKEYTAGLLHDMGKLVLVQYFPEQNAAVEAMILRGPVNDLDAEQKILSIPHTEIGKQIGAKWRLPKEYLEVMKHHHAPVHSVNHALLCAVVRCADLYCERWEFGIGESSEECLPDDETAGIVIDAAPPMGELPADEIERELRGQFESQIEHLQVLM